MPRRQTRVTVYRRPDPIPRHRTATPAVAPAALAPVKVEPDDLNRLVARQIFQAMLDGRFPPGSILPNEHQLATDLGVSRTALREAIKGLVSKGMLETRRKRGTQVLDRTAWNMLDPDVIAWSRRAGSRQVSEELWEALLTNLPELRSPALMAAKVTDDRADIEKLRADFCAVALELSSRHLNRFVQSVVATCLRSLMTEDSEFLDTKLLQLTAGNLGRQAELVD
jgi:DNA-binding FadR family transcriptional regulator